MVAITSASGGEPAQVARDQAQHDALAQVAQRALESRPRRAGGRACQRSAHFIGAERALDHGIQPECGLGFEQPRA